MKNLPAVFIVTLSTLVGGLLSGCSKEGAEAKNVNVPEMTQALKSPDKDTRVNACIELAKAGPGAATAVSSLIPLLKDSDALVRRLAAYALGQIGPKATPAIPALKELLNDQDRDVLTATVNALRSIDPKVTNVRLLNVETPP